MDDSDLLRYSRHILLDAFGPEAQARFAAARVLIVGLGGLGAPAAHYLAAAGVGELMLADADDVDLTNLQRQLLYATPDIGMRKTDAAAARLAAVNPHVKLTRMAERLTGDALNRAVASASIVLDCTDNFPTRQAINRAAVAHRVPLVSGAALRFDGQLAVFDPRDPASPCYHCLFGDGDELEEVRCATMGVLAPLTGIVGATQAAEALKLLAGAGTSLAGRLLVLDALTMRWTELAVPRDPCCAVCGDQ
jgi:adenylyltransferase/sulfurtransferase